MRVPSYDGGAVQEEGIPVVPMQKSLPVDTFGGGEATQKLTNSVTSFADKIKQDADQMAVLDAENQYSTLETQKLYDPNTGALFKKGKAAFPVKETTLSALNEGASNIEQKLANNTQKEAFRRRSQQRMQDAGRTLDQHVGSEMLQFDTENTQSFLDNRKDHAVKNFQDLDQVEGALQDSQGAVIQFGNRNGKGQEWIDQHTLDASSKISLGVVTQMVDNDMAPDARDYLKENAEHFNPEDLKKAHDLVKIVATKAEALKLSDEIFSKYSDSESKAYKALTEIEKPEVRMAARDQLKERFTEQDQAKTHDDNSLYLGLYNQLSGGAKITDTDIYRQMQSLTPERQEALKRVASGEATKTDPELNYKLVQMSSHPETYSKFQKVNLNDPVYRAGLSQADLLKWQDRQGKTFDDDQMKDLRSTKESVESVYSQAGLEIPKEYYKKDSTEAVQYNKFLDAVDAEVKRSGDSSPTNKAKIARDLIKEEIINKRGLPFGIFDVKRKRFDINPEDVDVNDLDPAVIKKLKTNLKLGGLDPENEANLKEAYAEALKAGLL